MLFNSPLIPEKHTNPEGKDFWTCTRKVDDYLSVTGMGYSPEDAQADLLVHLSELGFSLSPEA